MTEQMKAFLLAFADLLDKHDVDTVEAVDNGMDYYPSVDGVEFQMWTRWDGKGNETRDKCNVKIGKEFNGQDVRDLVTHNAELRPIDAASCGKSRLE